MLLLNLFWKRHCDEDLKRIAICYAKAGVFDYHEISEIDENSFPSQLVLVLHSTFEEECKAVPCCAYDSDNLYKINILFVTINCNVLCAIFRIILSSLCSCIRDYKSLEARKIILYIELLAKRSDPFYGFSYRLHIYLCLRICIAKE